MVLEYLKEVRATVALAIPMFLGFVGAMLIFLIDGLMLGRVGVDALAAYTFAAQVVSVLMVWGFGICAAQHVLSAAAFQQADWEESDHLLQGGCLITGAFGVVCGLLLQFGNGIMHWFGQEPQVVALSIDYAIFVGWSILPTMLHQNFKNYAEAQNHPWVMLLLFIPGLLANVFFNWLLIFGNWGFPEMGVGGAGLATLLSRVVMLVIVVVYYLRSKTLMKGKDYLRFSWQKIQAPMKRFLAIGVPSGFQSLMEHMMFVVVSIWMGWFGADALAAHSIEFRVGSFAFMVPLGISFAISMRISKANSAGDCQAVQRIGFSALLFTAFIMAVIGATFFTLRHQIGWWFFDEVDERTSRVVALSAQFIAVMACFQIFDALQFAANGALRGLSDMKVPIALMLICYWVVSMPLAYFLAFHTDIGSIGLLYGIFIGFALCSALLITRFVRLSSKHARTS